MVLQAVDWWSLGALAHEMLTGNPPFRSKNSKDLHTKILTAKVRGSVHPAVDTEVACSFLYCIPASTTKMAFKRCALFNQESFRAQREQTTWWREIKHVCRARDPSIEKPSILQGKSERTAHFPPSVSPDSPSMRNRFLRRKLIGMRLRKCMSVHR